MSEEKVDIEIILDCFDKIRSIVIDSLTGKGLIKTAEIINLCNEGRAQASVIKKELEETTKWMEENNLI